VLALTPLGLASSFVLTFVVPTVFLLSSAITLLGTRGLIRLLSIRRWTVEDAHKPGHPQVPRPGGPAIVGGIVAGEALVYFATASSGALALMLCTALAGIMGLLDDMLVFRGLAKPLLAVVAAIPLLLIPGAYDFHLGLPLYGAVFLPLIYPVLILLAVPVTANTFNSIDVLNGAVSGFTAIAATSVLIALALAGDLAGALIALPLTATAASFFYFHRYPSRVFPGDSGTLAFGTAYGALAVTGRVEIVAVVAILPAILNSFYFLASVRRIVEPREIKVRPVTLLPDGRLAANRDPRAPVTLVRLILADGPLGERVIVRNILILTAISGLMAVFTAILR
jgi:UDP-N-acetylglucosamine--dolichyl-phosphate N-acetylglucosaminephosphotransferase